MFLGFFVLPLGIILISDPEIRKTRRYELYQIGIKYRVETVMAKGMSFRKCGFQEPVSQTMMCL